jgi:sugar phosphate isomerase/epimerase
VRDNVRIMRKIGVQLYTVRETMKKDYLGTLKQVAEIGYKGVELAGNMGGMSATELRKVMDDLGLQVVSGHCGIDAVDGDLQKTLADYTALGAKYLGVAWIAEQYRTAEGIRRAADLMQRAGAEAARHGITFFYHNHAFEFETKVDGAYMLDALFAATDPALLKWESDVYWVAKGGEDAAAYLGRYAGRVPLVHIKDMTNDDARGFEIVGAGCLDFDKILAAGDAAGADWYIVEQDQCPKGEIESIRASYQNIVARGWM